MASMLLLLIAFFNLSLASSIFFWYSTTPRVGLQKHRPVKRLSKTLGRLLCFLFNLVFYFGDDIFHQYIGTVAFLRVFVVASLDH